MEQKGCKINKKKIGGKREEERTEKERKFEGGKNLACFSLEVKKKKTLNKISSQG